VPHRGGIVGEHADLRRLRHRREPRELRLADDLVGDEHVANAGGDERFGFADLLAADADRPRSICASAISGTCAISHADAARCPRRARHSPSGRGCARTRRDRR
jgi:hypothetical protein